MKKTELLKPLLEIGVDVTANDNEAIRYSVKNGHTEVVNLLVEALVKK